MNLIVKELLLCKVVFLFIYLIIEMFLILLKAREKDASSYEKRMGNEISNTLRKMIDQYFLRRTKAAVFGNNKNDKENHGEMDRDEISSVDGTQR